ncbi:MAG: efflux RND transporter periplasmic adaptor subunit [Methylococcales bacterium]|nr:efflux RND transporter periplasmic adaptor subunit [Methylococcales bacterium]
MTHPHAKTVNVKKAPRRFGFQKHRNSRLLIVTMLAVLLSVIYAFYWWQFASHFVVTNDAYVTGNLIPLKAQTSGTVVDVRVDNTQYVHQGDVLVRLDGLQAQVALEQAQANLAESVREVETLFSQSDMLRQKLAAKEAILHRSQRDLARYRGVANDGVVSAQQIENSEFQVREQEADVNQLRAELGGAEALIQNTTPADNPKVLQAMAKLKEAYLDKMRQEIVAPVSGFIAKRNIQLGDQVRPETPLLVIVPLDYLWVEANFLENELENVQPGQPVEISVDLYGSKVVYHGNVLGLGAGTGSVFGLLPPDNATGNYIHISERVPVRIGLKAEELVANPLRPGLSATVHIDTRLAGQSVLQPLTPMTTYQTDVYDNQLKGADALIHKIIEKNRRAKK